jgi:hypothetical protein
MSVCAIDWLGGLTFCEVEPMAHAPYERYSLGPLAISIGTSR